MQAPLQFPDFPRTRTSRRARQALREYLKFSKELQELLAFFGFTLMAQDPGLDFRKGNAKRYNPADVIRLEGRAFSEIIPLLYELRALRVQNGDSGKAPQRAQRSRRRV